MATLDGLTDPGAAYTMSKLLAHVAADDFMKMNKPSFDLIRILPGFMQGASELYSSATDMRDPAKLGSNSGTMLTALGMSAGGGPRPTHQTLVNDVAKAHVLALKPEIAKNGDNFLTVGNEGVGMPWEDVVTIIKEVFPDAVAKGVLKPEMKDQNFIERYEVGSTEKALGYKFASPEDMVKSVVGQYLQFVEVQV
jgi:nucleoside-diphosphate-sugar epimerase